MKIELAVLFGGRSVEHEVSVNLCIAGMENLDKKKYSVHPVYIAKPVRCTPATYCAPCPPI